MLLALFIFLLQIPFMIFKWRLFNSAGEKGWYSLIPIYNIVILLKIVRLKWIFVFLYLLPIIAVSVLPPIFLVTVFFTMFLVYRALVCIGKKPYHFMEFLFEVTILSPIFFLVLSIDSLNYDPLRLKHKSL